MLFKIIQSKIWLYLIAGIGLASLQALSLHSLVDTTFLTLFFDGLIFSGMYFFFSFPLLNVLRYGNLHLMVLPVRIFNYIILTIFILVITLTAGYGVELIIFGPEIKPIFITTLPLKALISVLVYCLIILFNRIIYLSEEMPPHEIPVVEKGIDVTATTTDNTTAEKATTGALERFAVKTGTKIHVVLVEEIICLLADGDYVQVITSKGKFLKEQTMKYFESNLPVHLFVRVHRSCIVNVTAISRIELYDKQSQQIILKNGEKIRVSQTGYKLLKEKLKL
jgi:hypothetical protein